jgi:hypothetical protein
MVELVMGIIVAYISPTPKFQYDPYIRVAYSLSRPPLAIYRVLEFQSS